MSEEVKGSGGTPAPTSGGQVKEDITTTSGGQSVDTVSFQSHVKLMDEKKKISRQLNELIAEKEANIKTKNEEQGKYKDMYDTSQKKLELMESAAKRGAIKGAFKKELVQAGVVEDSYLDLLVDKVDVKSFSIDPATYEVDASQVQHEVTNFKTNYPKLFTKKLDAPKDGNPTFNNGAFSGSDGPDFSKMSKDELIAYGQSKGL